MAFEEVAVAIERDGLNLIGCNGRAVYAQVSLTLEEIPIAVKRDRLCLFGDLFADCNDAAIFAQDSQFRWLPVYCDAQSFMGYSTNHDTSYGTCGLWAYQDLPPDMCWCS